MVDKVYSALDPGLHTDCLKRHHQVSGVLDVPESDKLVEVI